MGRGFTTDMLDSNRLDIHMGCNGYQ